jgi:hypothetical protein
MQFTDVVTVAGTRRRDDGYLVADARIARTGIQNYLGWEVGKPDLALVSSNASPRDLVTAATPVVTIIEGLLWQFLRMSVPGILAV